MTHEAREFMKGGANIHVREHYRVLNGKLIYVAAHDKMGAPVGTEAQLHERVQHGKNKAHLMTIDPEDRDTVLKHAGQLGLKPEVKYQGGKIRDHQGNVKAHGFHYLKFDSEEDAAKVHASISAASKGKAVDTPDSSESEQPEGKIGINPEESYKGVKEAQEKLQSFISIGDAMAIQHAIKGTIPAEKGIELADQGLELANAAVAAAEAYEKETGDTPPSAQAFKDIVAKLESWKQQLQAKVKPAEDAKVEEKPEAPPEVKEHLGKTWKAAGGEKIVKGWIKHDGKPKLVIGGKDSNSNINQVIDPSELESEMAFDAKQAESHEKNQAAKKEQDEASAKAKAEHDDVDGFTDNMNPNMAEKAKIFLSGKIQGADGKVSSIKDFVRNKIQAGATIKDYQGKSYLTTPDGVMTSEKSLGKTGMLYAEFLAKKGNSPGSSEGSEGSEVSPQSKLSEHMKEAEGNFNSNPKAAIDALRKGAELAEKHGLSHTHAASGKQFDAAWMKKMADDMEAALPKEPTVDEEYTRHAKGATDASAEANQHTSDLKGEAQNGEHTPDKAEATMLAHASAGNKHMKAKVAHLKAADKAPTPELASFHQKKADEHEVHGKVHATAMQIHEKQHKKNQTQEVYDSEAAKAEALTTTADDHSHQHHLTQHQEEHDDAANIHEDAAKAHTGMIQHALANGDEQAANEHASIATHHQKKADFHKAAAAAWKSTNQAEAGQVTHAKASALHSAAAQAAEEANFSGAMNAHDNKSKVHLDTHKEQKAKENPHAKKADDASDEAKDWSWTPSLEPDQHAKAAKAHNIAVGAHMKAAEGAEDKQAHYTKAKHHSNMVDYHNKASNASETSGEANTFHGVEHKHTFAQHEHAAKLHAKAAKEHEELTQHPGIAESQKHQAFHAEAADHHQQMAEKHTKFAASQKSAEDQDKADEEASQPSNPWKGKDSTAIGNQGHEAYNKGNWAAAVQHYKHAAVVAHHNGHSGDAQNYANLAKEAAAKMKGVQKAVDTGGDTVLELGDPQKLVVAIQSAAVQVHREKLQVRNMLKAVDTMPSFAKLQSACVKATAAGITSIEDIVAHALGGKEQAAPYLHFLSNVSQ